MRLDELIISGRKCFLHREADASHLLLQPVDAHDLELLGGEIEAICRRAEARFSLVAIGVEDWNRELTPWAAPAVFGKTPFGDGAHETLTFIAEELLPCLTVGGVYDRATMKLHLGGYSLAGLFALWAAYQTDVFDGIAAASPSVWFPRWTEYASERRPFAKSVYLSLGDKEERARNPVMAQVGNAIRRLHELLTTQDVDAVLEWNSGNHFVDSDQRMAKGFAWLLNAADY